MPAQPHQIEPVPEAFRHLVPDHGKTPWHPSVRATERVPDPMPVPTVCSCCGAHAIEIRHHTQIYHGHEFGEWPWAYVCSACGAMVGMHPFTSIPLGTLADGPLRRLRKACKQPFNLLWVHKRMTRDEAYAALAKHLGIPAAQCHFGLLDDATCRAARDWAVDQLRATA